MRLLGLVIVLCCAQSTASADEPETPWGKGVSGERRAAAQAKLADGNALFLQNRFREALAVYKEALQSWDHPAIRFNVVRCLIALDQPLDAFTNLERALAFGKEPFEEQIYTEALNYQRLLAGQIGELEVTCSQPGVEVKLDGKLFVQCPGKASSRAVPGIHVLVAQKAGHQTLTKDLVLLPGKKQTEAVQLETLADATEYRTRWATWQPWAVAGLGAAVAGVGFLVDQQGRSQLDQLRRAFAATCTATACTREQFEALDYEATEQSAITKNRIGIGVMVAGGAIVAAGIVGVILNRPRPYVKERRGAVTLAPALTPTSASIGVQGAF